MGKQELLERYVAESNAIEKIYVKKTHHLFADHLEAAEIVWQRAEEWKAVVRAKSIHGVLMKRETRIGREILEPGKFRKVGVRVGIASKPQPENLERLMGRWEDSLLSDLWTPSDTADKLALHYHHWFEAIHPFRDGNGRTGRLLLNGIRLVFDLPWLIVLADERQEYYDSIRQWEAEHRDLLEL
ncbi:MAG: Fic family protein [bacterium]|nr:Fic family protein [bacterium]